MPVVVDDSLGPEEWQLESEPILTDEDLIAMIAARFASEPPNPLWGESLVEKIVDLQQSVVECYSKPAQDLLTTYDVAPWTPPPWRQ